MAGLIGRKLGMTSVFKEGIHVPVTVLEFEPNVITQIKNEERDGYTAVQLAVGNKKEKSTSKAMKGHFEKAGTSPKRIIFEMRDYTPDNAELGVELKVEDVFEEGQLVDVIGITKGKGFQGVVKRHGFAGVGDRTHGQHNRERAPGSIGQSATPSKVHKGTRMGGQTGNRRVKTKNMAVIQILPDAGLMLVQGPVPGRKGSYVRVVKTNRMY